MTTLTKHKLIDVIELIGGGTPKTSVLEYWNGNIPWISVKDFNNDNRYVYSTEKYITKEGLNHSSTKLLQKDDIIISARGTVGELAMVPYPMAFNQSCYGIRGINSINQTFLYYLIKACIYKLKAISHGSVFDTITRDTFSNIDILLPDTKTQDIIAEFLSSVDDKIEINQSINNNLEQQAQAIFNNKFVNVEAIPDNWQIGNLSGIADYLNGLAMQKFRPNEDEVGIPVLKIKELRQGFCDKQSDLCSPNIRSEYLINNGDVVFSWSGTLWLDLWGSGLCGLNQHLFKVTSSKYDKWFYYFWTKYHLNKFIAIAADKATTMGHIKREDLDRSRVLIPDNETYIQLNSALSPILELIIKNKDENRQLIQLRDTLLPKLMSGEIDVSNVKIDEKFDGSSTDKLSFSEK